jgi:hypothetical protein
LIAFAIVAAVVIAIAALIYRRIFITPRQRRLAEALAARELANT